MLRQREEGRAAPDRLAVGRLEPKPHRQRHPLADPEPGEIARHVPDVAGPEHAVEIELPFLQAALGRFCLVPVLVGDTRPRDQKAFAAALAGLDDGRTLFVFSSDFAHYGPRYDFEPFGPLSPGTRERIRETLADGSSPPPLGHPPPVLGQLERLGVAVPQ